MDSPGHPASDRFLPLLFYTGELAVCAVWQFIPAWELRSGRILARERAQVCTYLQSSRIPQNRTAVRGQ
jgi:hypothetical protein